jgi:S1-C subfamily serine protease
MAAKRLRGFGLLACLVALAGCAVSSGVVIPRIGDPVLAGAYIALSKTTDMGIDHDEGAAVAIAPGIAVTNAHNANLVDPAQVIGTSTDYDLLFFRADRTSAPPDAAPAIGEPVTAYGQGASGDLRVAHGVVRAVQPCPGCGPSAWFTFAGDAGPGFSGGPVVDAQGRLVGITFGYKDEGGGRLIYAYEMARVRAELRLVSPPLPQGRN